MWHILSRGATDQFLRGGGVSCWRYPFGIISNCIQFYLLWFITHFFQSSLLFILSSTPTFQKLQSSGSMCELYVQSPCIEKCGNQYVLICTYFNKCELSLILLNICSDSFSPLLRASKFIHCCGHDDVKLCPTSDNRYIQSSSIILLGGTFKKQK